MEGQPGNRTCDITPHIPRPKIGVLESACSPSSGGNETSMADFVTTITQSPSSGALPALVTLLVATDAIHTNIEGTFSSSEQVTDWSRTHGLSLIPNASPANPIDTSTNASQPSLSDITTKVQTSPGGDNKNSTPAKSSSSSPATSQSSVVMSSVKSGSPTRGVSSAALAGTAIACLLAGAAAAGLLAWAIFAYRRKYNRRPPHTGLHSEAASSPIEDHKYVPLVPVPVRSSEQEPRSESEVLPVPPPRPVPAAASIVKRKRISAISVNALEKALSVLRTHVKTLFEQIEMHVDNFYLESNDGLPVLSSEQQQRLQEFETPYLEDSVAGVLPEAQQPRTLIKHCLAHTIISGIDFTSGENCNQPLLPWDMMSLYRIISNTASEQQQRQWRNDTMALIGSDAIVGTVNAGTVAQCFTYAFSPWASERYSPEARISHLTKVINEAVVLGAELFGRPGDFKWHWQNRAALDGDSSLHTVVVLPGLSMVTANQDLNSSSEQNSDPAEKKYIEVVAPSVAAL